LTGTAKNSGIPRGLDQGIQRPHVETVGIEELPVSPMRATCLQPRVDGEPNKQLKKTQKRRRDEIESMAGSICDFSIGVQGIDTRGRGEE
jgi:hypothetical protein